MRWRVLVVRGLGLTFSVKVVRSSFIQGVFAGGSVIKFLSKGVELRAA